MKRSGNAVLTDPVPVNRNEEFAALELLPPELRRALQQASVNINAIDVARAWYRHLGKWPRETLLRIFLDCLDCVEQEDITQFAKAWRQQCAMPYPHLAASATIQRSVYT